MQEKDPCGMQDVAPGKATLTTGGLFSTDAVTGFGDMTGAVGVGDVEPQAADTHRRLGRKIPRSMDLARRGGGLMLRECSTAGHLAARSSIRTFS